MKFISIHSSLNPIHLLPTDHWWAADATQRRQCGCSEEAIELVSHANASVGPILCTLWHSSSGGRHQKVRGRVRRHRQYIQEDPPTPCRSQIINDCPFTVPGIDPGEIKLDVPTRLAKGIQLKLISQRNGYWQHSENRCVHCLSNTQLVIKQILYR